MDVPTVARVLLRLAHGLASVLWLGGAAYYLLALRPQVKQADPAVRDVVRAAQKEFGEWASVATLIMVATGVVLMFDRLTDGQGTATYVALLGLKIISAVIAFWMVSSISRRRRRQPTRRRALDRSWIILMLGTGAFIIGVVLSSVYPNGIS